MATVYVFLSTGRFRSLKEMRQFIDQTYTEDGDGIPSSFMREVGLSEYELRHESTPTRGRLSAPL
jgi:Immunity protein 22